MKTRLVVIVPRLDGSSASWNPLVGFLKSEPQLKEEVADWLKFPHRTRALGIRGLAPLARELAALINQRWINNGGFKDIILIGHSVGGMLVRQAYLEAVGLGTAWASKVNRIVLLAAPNRGVPRLPWYGRPVDWFLRLFLFWVKFNYQDLVQGSAFVTNLRIQWIRHFSSGHANSSHLPTVVLLRGTNDAIVEKDASHDVLAFPNTSYVEIPGGTHENLPRLRTRRAANGQKELTEEGRERFTLLRNAIIGTLESLGLIESPPPKPKRAHFANVVFILHGIRASEIDDWVSDVATEIQSKDALVLVVRLAYRYITAWRFVLPSVRRRNLRWFQDEYTELLAQNPDAEFHFIGHSNGTYMLGHSLLEIPAMQFKRVVLAGSVLPDGFFAAGNAIIARNQVEAVRSDGGRFDWPVGILCRVLCRVLRMKDVGCF